MQLDLVSETWQSLKGYVNPIDREDAAQSLVSALIDNGVDAEDIQAAFRGEADVRAALTPYLDDIEDVDSEDEDYDELNFDIDE